MAAKKRKKKRVIAYDIVSRTDAKDIQRITVQNKGERHAEKVFDGLCYKVDFERFFIKTVRG